MLRSSNITGRPVIAAVPWRAAGGLGGRLLSFVSLALATQIVLMIQQLALLPVQIHIWGHASTAYWYAAISIAAVTSVADLGLRGAGHADLLKMARDPADDAARDRFAQTWLWIRLLVAGLTLMVAVFVFATNFSLPLYNLAWRTTLVVAGGLETILTIRIMYLDSLEKYNWAESGYLVYAATRLVASLVALMVCDGREGTLAAIYLVSVAMALGLQGVVCQRMGVLQLWRGLGRKPSLRGLAAARYTVAGPLALWMQMHFPVVVLSALASPVAVTVYVALRAIFGVARQTVQQLARAASVEYIRARSGTQADAALSLMMVAMSCLGAWLFCIIIGECQTIMQIIGAAEAITFFQVSALTFGLTASFLPWQVVMAVMIRLSQVPEIAHRQYLYIALACVAAIIAIETRSPTLYVFLAAAAELVMALCFLGYSGITASGHGRRRAGARAATASVISAAAVLLVWMVQTKWIGVPRTEPTSVQIVAAIAIVGCYLGAIGAAQLLANLDLFRVIPMFNRKSRACDMS